MEPVHRHILGSITVSLVHVQVTIQLRGNLLIQSIRQSRISRRLALKHISGGGDKRFVSFAKASFIMLNISIGAAIVIKLALKAWVF